MSKNLSKYKDEIRFLFYSVIGVGIIQLGRVVYIQFGDLTLYTFAALIFGFFMTFLLKLIEG